MLREEERVMSKKQWCAKSTYLLVALALVLSLGLVAVPMAGTVEANGGEDYYVATTGNNANDGMSSMSPMDCTTRPMGRTFP